MSFHTLSTSSEKDAISSYTSDAATILGEGKPWHATGCATSKLHCPGRKSCAAPRCNQYVRAKCRNNEQVLHYSFRGGFMIFAYIDPNTSGLLMQYLVPVFVAIGAGWIFLKDKISET